MARCSELTILLFIKRQIHTIAFLLILIFQKDGKKQSQYTQQYEQQHGRCVIQRFRGSGICSIKDNTGKKGYAPETKVLYGIHQAIGSAYLFIVHQSYHGRPHGSRHQGECNTKQYHRNMGIDVGESETKVNQ